MGFRHLLKLVSLIALAKCTAGFGSGAPTASKPEICQSLQPYHDQATKQTSASPYTVTYSPSNFTPGGSNVTVTIESTDPATHKFKGFLLTAAHGTFIPDSAGLSQLACTEGKALTHTSDTEKSSLSFQWTPPASTTGHVPIRATFVKEKHIFWQDIPNIPLLTDNTPGATAPTTLSSSVSGIVVKDSACGSSKGCYSSCSGNSCDFVATWAQGSSADSVQITLKGKVEGNNQYVALGLSLDKEMGSDSVTFCVPSGAYNSYNVDNGKDNELLPNSTEGLSKVQADLVDGVLTCSFDRLIAADSSGKRYALNKQYTLFVAMGPGTAAGIGFHDKIPTAPDQTASLVDFSVDIAATATDNVLVKTHGSLMIVAWILAASIGIVIARFGKNAWEDTTIFGQKVWFQIHRTCMVLAFFATAIAFVIIFIDVGGYSEIYGETYKKSHPILGIIVMALTLLNPIMALFRPHPGTEKRPIFNWAHWGVGISAYTLGVIAIFFGISLDKAEAPDYMIYILAAFVAWQFLIQVILEIMQYCKQRGAGSAERYEMTDVSNTEPGKIPQSKQSGGNKRLLLFLHMLVVLGFTIALITVLNIGLDHDHDH